MKKIILLLALLLAATAAGARSFVPGNGTFLLDGKPFVVKAAELHYPRIPRPYWEHRIMMCKALGMNTVCLYVFWNVHEPREGVFDFSGQNDVAAFCRLAQKHGMLVVVRPGPYVCAEWEMGGLPWWLLKKKDIALRELDPYFMERVRRFEREVGRQLAPLTIDKGGPIVMVQVENEYGSYGTSKPYVAAIRDIIREAGFDKVTLFQCDWASNFEHNGLDDLVWTMNFGTGANVDEQFRRLAELRPGAPLMCSEYWSGWFDKWGARHETRPASDMVAGIDQMLSRGISFSLYMTHGGTSFGHWAGANSPGFAPDVTSYDYDAPISEWGAPTPKYWLLRATLARYAADSLPPVPPAPLPRIAVPEFELTAYAPLAAGVAQVVHSDSVRTMEELNMGFGIITYSTALPALEGGGVLTINDCHDYARVMVDGVPAGTVSRLNNEKTVTLPPCREGARLTIVVEAMGRINFGRAIKDFKGITTSVTVAAHGEQPRELTGWRIGLIPDDYERACTALKDAVPVAARHRKAGYYRGHFTLNDVGDTFLSTEHLGKGQLYVNGHALGRYWNIGPQQALYVPGCWLREGENEVVALDVEGVTKPVMRGHDEPRLDELRTHRHADNRQRPHLSALEPVAQGELPAGNGWHTVKWNTTTQCRRVALECLSTHDGSAATIAELHLLDAQGRRLSRETWTVAFASSEDAEGGNHTGDKAFDLQESTYWSTAPAAAAPHLLVVDQGETCHVSAMQWLPRAEQDAPGAVKAFRVYALP